MDSKQEVEVEMEQERERGIVVVGSGVSHVMHQALVLAARDTGTKIIVDGDGATITFNGKVVDALPVGIDPIESESTKTLRAALGDISVSMKVSDNDLETLYLLSRSRCIPGNGWTPITNQHGGKGKGDRIRRRKQFMPQKPINKGRR